MYEYYFSKSIKKGQSERIKWVYTRVPSMYILTESCKYLLHERKIVLMNPSPKIEKNFETSSCKLFFPTPKTSETNSLLILSSILKFFEYFRKKYSNLELNLLGSHQKWWAVKFFFVGNFRNSLLKPSR